MTDRRDINLIAPYVKLAAATFDELRENDEKQTRKLSAHDDAFGLLYKDLETLQTLMQTQLDAVSETLAKIRGRLNGR